MHEGIVKTKIYATKTALMIIVGAYFAYLYISSDTANAINEDLSYYGVLGERVEAPLKFTVLENIDRIE